MMKVQLSGPSPMVSFGTLRLGQFFNHLSGWYLKTGAVQAWCLSTEEGCAFDYTELVVPLASGQELRIQRDDE